MPGLTASIVAYHTDPRELIACVDTLTAIPELRAVYIVDNSRDPATEALVKSFGRPQVHYIPSENRGYGAGHNIAIRLGLQSGADYHLVLNSDIVFEPATVVELLRLMESDPSVGLTIPKVLGLDGREQSSYHPLPTPWDLIAHRFVPRRWVQRRMDRYEIKVEGRTEPLRVPYVHGCFMLMSTQALRDVGLFDERFFMYPEDIDLTRRINERYRALVVPTLSIVHAHRAESRRSLRMLRIHATNMIRYFNKWGWHSK